jgi:hypothetical protein
MGVTLALIALACYAPAPMQQPPWQVAPGPAPAQVPPYVPAQPLTPGPSDVEGVSVLRAVKTVFESPNWKTNVLMGLVFMLIPIVGPLALGGWMCECHQRHIRRHPDPFPKIDFGDFGDYIKRGLAPFLVGLIVSLPLIFLFYMFGAGAAFGVIAVAGATNDPLITTLVAVAIGLVGLFLMMLISVPMNAAQTRAELTEDFGQALSFGKIMSYAKATFGRVLIKNFIYFFVALGIILIGMLLCYLGIYPAAVVLQIASMHLRYQIYSDYLARGGEPIPMKPPQPLTSEQKFQQQPYAAQPQYAPPPGRY